MVDVGVIDSLILIALVGVCVPSLVPDGGKIGDVGLIVAVAGVEGASVIGDLVDGNVVNCKDVADVGVNGIVIFLSLLGGGGGGGDGPFGGGGGGLFDSCSFGGGGGGGP